MAISEKFSPVMVTKVPPWTDPSFGLKSVTCMIDVRVTPSVTKFPQVEELTSNEYMSLGAPPYLTVIVLLAELALTTLRLWHFFVVSTVGQIVTFQVSVSISCFGQLVAV